MRSSEGLFISVDGPSGVGKSDTVQALSRMLTDEGKLVYVTCEPSDGPIGKLAREVTDTVHGNSLACLCPLPTAIGCARDHAKVVLAEWGLTHREDDAVTLVSELMTNALRASQALSTPTPIVLRLLANDWQLIIEAWDQWVEGYSLTQSVSDDEHGWGLTVVSALSQRWGVGRIHDNYARQGFASLSGTPR